MRPAAHQKTGSSGARGKLLAAAVSCIRRKGYAATSVDELCAMAAVTKGAFFHHFPTKDDLAVAAADHWAQSSHDFFAAAPYHRRRGALERLLGYIDFRKAMLRGEVAEFSCLAGTLVQEVYGTHPKIRAACDACIAGHAAEVELLITDALAEYGVRTSWTAMSLALHTQAVLQGAFILAKAHGTAGLVEASVGHLRRYIESLFVQSRKGGVGGSRGPARRRTQARRRKFVEPSIAH